MDRRPARHAVARSRRSPKATWFLAEGMDAAVMTRSIPIAKA